MTHFYLVSAAGTRIAVEPPSAKGQPGRAARACPGCGAAAPLRLTGKNPYLSKDDRALEAPAFAACCGAEVGLLRAEPETLFGVREDHAVLEGRPRVYGGGAP